jgi:hypothetical protein
MIARRLANIELSLIRQINALATPPLCLGPVRWRMSQSGGMAAALQI